MPFFGASRRAILLAAAAVLTLPVTLPEVVFQPTYTQPDKLYFASNRTRTPTARAIPTAGREFMCSHVDLGVAPYPTSDYVAGLPAHYTSAVPADNENPATNPFNLEGVSIGYGLTPGMATWFPFVSVADAALGVPGGVSGITLDPATNSTGAVYRASGANIPANVRRYLRVAHNVAAGGYVPCGIEVNTVLGEGQVGQATSAASFLSGGTVNTSGRLGGTLYSASWVACKGHDGRPVMLNLGDSIHYGQNENGSNFTSGAGGGAISRALVDTVSSALFLGANMCVPGTGPSDIAVNGRAKTARKWDLIAKLTALNGGTIPFTHATCNHLSNSLGATYNTLGTLVPMIKGYVGVVNAEWPGIPIAYQGGLPKAPTTDGFQTLAGQTPGSNDATTGVRWQFNDKLFADNLDGAVQWAINAAQYISAPTARDKWDVQVPVTGVTSAATASGGLHYFFDDASWVQQGDFISANPDTGGSGAAGAGASVLGVDMTVTPHDVLVSTSLGAQPSGTKFSRHLASDAAGLHPGTSANIRMMRAWIQWKNSLWAPVGVFSKPDPALRPAMSASAQTLILPAMGSYNNASNPGSETTDLYVKTADGVGAHQFQANIYGYRNIIVENVHLLDTISFYGHVGHVLMANSCIDVFPAGGANPLSRISDCFRSVGKLRSDGLLAAEVTIDFCNFGGTRGSVDDHTDCRQVLNGGVLRRFTTRCTTLDTNYQIDIFQNQPGDPGSSEVQFIEYDRVNMKFNTNNPSVNKTKALYLGSGKHPGNIKDLFIDWRPDMTLSESVMPVPNAPGQAAYANIPAPDGLSIVFGVAMEMPGRIYKGLPPGGDFCPKAAVARG